MNPHPCGEPRQVCNALTPGGSAQSGTDQPASGAIIAGVVLRQCRQQARQILRRRTFPLHRLPTTGVLQTEQARVQGLPRKRSQALSQWLRQPAAADQLRAVGEVPHQRMPEMGEVHPDLMGTTGLKAYSKVRVMPEMLFHPIVGDRLPSAAGQHGHLHPVAGVAPDRSVDGPAGDQRPLGNRVVLPPHLARRQLRHQRRVRFQRQRHHEQPAGVLVETVDDTRARHGSALRKVMQQGVLQGAVGLPRARMNGQPRGLDDDRNVRVRMQYLQGNRLGQHPRIRHWLRIKLDHRALRYRITGTLDHHTVDPHPSLGQPLLQPGPAVLFEQTGTGHIGATAGEMLVHHPAEEVLLVVPGRHRRHWLYSTAASRTLSDAFMTTVLRSLGFAIVLATLGACASKGDTVLPPDNPFGPDRVSQRELRLEATELYRAAREALMSSDFATAISRYDMLITRYPFSVFSTQAELERVYAYHRSFEPDRALAAADRFLRDHPRHEAGAYIHYLKGVINQSRGDRVLTGLGVDTTKDDVTYARRAFDDFALLVQKYPDSPYVADARQRMIEMRNRIASHELHIVRFYVKRGAYLAAARRAETLVATYPGAPAAAEALALMERSYRTLGLDAQAAAAEQLARGNNLPTAADLGEREIKPSLLRRISTTVGGWFGLGDDTDDGALGVES